MNRYQIIFFISFCLLLFYKAAPREKRKYIHKSYKSNIKEKFKNKEAYKIFITSTTGIKIPLKRKTKKWFQNLTLLHLFTPSGIHLSSFFMVLFPFISLFSRFHKKIKPTATLLVLFSPWLLTGYFSIKRITLVKMTSLLTKNLFGFKIEAFYLFLIVFFIDFIFGTYSQSPLSFIFSFLFIGIIYSSNDSDTSLPYLLWGGQVLISFFMGGTLTVLGPILGFFITLIFSFIFPILLSYHPFSYLIDFNYAEYLLNHFLTLIKYSNNLALSSSSYSISLPILLCAYLISSNRKSLIPFLVLIHSNS